MKKILTLILLTATPFFVQAAEHTLAKKCKKGGCCSENVLAKKCKKGKCGAEEILAKKCNKKGCTDLLARCGKKHRKDKTENVEVVVPQTA